MVVWRMWVFRPTGFYLFDSRSEVDRRLHAPRPVRMQNDALVQGVHPSTEMLGSVTANMHAARDIAPYALSLDENGLHAWWDRAPDALFGFDRALRHIYLNLAGERLLGRPADQVRGRTHAELQLGPELADLWQAAIGEVFASGTETELCCEFATAAGRRWVETRLFPKLDAQGQVVAVLAVARDVTEGAGSRKRTRDVARADFLTVVAHELRTPVTSLTLHASSLVRRLREGQHETGAILEHAEKIVRQTRDVVTVIDRLLDMSRADSGFLALNLEEADLAEIVRGVLDRRHGHSSCSDPSSIEVRLQGGIVGRWDALRVEQIVTSLVSNAMRFGCGHPVVVEVSGVGSGGRIAVEDHGIGIAAEDQERIFQRFERASHKNYGGLGLGLWLVAEVVNAMQGVVRVESALGAGAKFTVELPAAPLVPSAAG
jgi:PAS domain S-box-containing protein